MQGRIGFHKFAVLIFQRPCLSHPGVHVCVEHKPGASNSQQNVWKNRRDLNVQWWWDGWMEGRRDGWECSQKCFLFEKRLVTKRGSPEYVHIFIANGLSWLRLWLRLWPARSLNYRSWRIAKQTCCPLLRTLLTGSKSYSIEVVDRLAWCKGRQKF